MSKVEIELTAKEQQMVAAWKRGRQSVTAFNNELDKVGGKNRKNKSSGDRFFKSVRNGANSGLASVKGMITGLVGVTAVVGTVKAAYSEWRQEMQSIGDESKRFHRDLVQDLATSGDLLQGSKVRDALENFDTATRAQSLSAFGGVRGAAPSINLDRALDLTRESAKAGKVFDASQLKELGGVAGFIGEKAPKKTAGDVLDIAQSIRADLGDRSGEANTPAFRRGVQLLQDEIGLSLEVAVATMVEGIRSSRMRAGTVGDAFAQVTRDIQPVTSPRNAKDRLQNRLAKMSPAERFREALKDDDARKLLFGTNAAKLGQLTPERIEKAKQRFRRAQTQDQFQQDIAATERQFPVTAQERQADIDLDVSKRPIESRERGRNVRRQQLETKLNQDDRNAITRFILRRGLDVSEIIDDVTGNQPTVLKPAVPKDRFVSPEEQERRDRLKFVEQQRLAGTNEVEIGKLMREQNGLLKETLDEMKAQRNPPPVNVNVRVQNNASESPRGTGAAALGVQGG